LLLMYFSLEVNKQVISNNRLGKMVTRLFELDCGYHSRASHDDIDPRSRSKATNELADDMQKELSTPFPSWLGAVFGGSLLALQPQFI
ncbi:hypothetical protein, partial [uncultured Nostoc sp.]|uniref:hypothetical protein n=1 Tax=uncultured Nostoc sp. TaxID=340711 RepID=UPI0035CA06B9